jgi:hypothetical protein
MYTKAQKEANRQLELGEEPNFMRGSKGLDCQMDFRFCVRTAIQQRAFMEHVHITSESWDGKTIFPVVPVEVMADVDKPGPERSV